ncbi:MAG TPA: S8 family serine peptidase [Thermoanaerobaculia bacterium]|nr:S8 family serine peptidase [Thermoanaerobaculia bacterium]
MGLARVFSIASSLLYLTVAAVPAATAPSEPSAKAVYIVQLAGAPLALSRVAGEPGKLDLNSMDKLRSLEALRIRQDATLAAAGRALGHDVEPLQRYSLSFNGLALELTGQEAAALVGVPGVRQVQRSLLYHISSDAGPAWTGAPGIWGGTTTAGLPSTQGEGIVIGVIDTGIALGHPAFADHGEDGYDHVNPRGSGNYLGWCSPSSPDYDPALACNDKLIGVWSYGEAGGDPRDDNGHGTHTAGIAAGNHLGITVPGTSLTRQISGVAPHANLIAYDACDGEGSCESATLVAAIDQAVADGVDVINLSVAGPASSPWHDPVALALLGARDAGIFVAAALSNGSEIGSPGLAPWVLAVAASTHNRRFASSLAGVSGGTLPPPDLAGSGLTRSTGPLAVVLGASYGDYSCSSPFPAGTFTGKIVVCGHSSQESETAKGQNVLAGGAGGLILAESGSDGPAEPVANVLPAVRLAPEVSPSLWSWLATGSGQVARIAGTTAVLDAAFGDRLWPGSPTGPARDVPDILKPDVAAPGQDILAAHIASGGYAVLSGTSMASAHAAGAAALLLALHSDWSPAEIQSALQTTGVGIASALEAGGGRLDLGAAARAGLVLPIGTADFAAADPWNGGHPRALNLAGLQADLCSPGCAWTRVVKSTLPATSHWTVSVEVPDGVTLTVTPSSFTLGPGGTQSLQITVAGISALSGWQLASIVLGETGEQASQARLPVAAFFVTRYPVAVDRAGAGSGRVTSDPAGIDCGSDCAELYPEDSSVTLTATVSAGSVFAGWSGACDGSEPTCSFSLFSPESVTAHFDLSTPDKSLTNQVPLKDSISGPVASGTWSYYFADLGSGNGELVVDLLDLTAAADLSVRFGSKPTLATADCRDADSHGGLRNRRCVLMAPAAGRWWIAVNNRDAGVTINYSVRASWGTASDRELANRSSYGDSLSSSQAGDTWRYYFVDLAAGSTGLTVELSTLSAAADLLLRYGAKPDRSHDECAAAEIVASRRCAISAPAAGRWWIAVNNLAAGTTTYTVKASWQTADTPTSFSSIASCRVLDTRTSAQPLVAGVPRIFQVAGQCGIPLTAKAVAINLTVVGPTGSGNLTLYPGDEGVPIAAAISFGAGQMRTNNAILKLAPGGAGTLGAVASTGAGQVHLIVDVSGYFQ